MGIFMNEILNEGNLSEKASLLINLENTKNEILKIMVYIIEQNMTRIKTL
jgi:hypothetical protein